MKVKNFHPEHMNVMPADIEGNNGIGRYIFLPGSDSRAEKIAKNFKNLTVKEHPRRHNLYMGTLEKDGLEIDVASISSGMGAPSVDIIVNELIRLGAKRFLRVGTSGLLQPKYMKGGDLAIATAAVRDEGASKCYLPPEYPAVASIDFVLAAQKAAQKLNYKRFHTGIFHTKDSLYAREFGESPQAEMNKSYMLALQGGGAIASEMEASMLFILANLFDHRMQLHCKGDKSPQNRVKAGVVAVVLGEGADYGTPKTLQKMSNDLMTLALETIIELARQESRVRS